jgi:hypothetical protein
LWRHFLIYNSIHIKKVSYAKRCNGVVVAHEMWLMVRFHGKFFISHPVESMNSYCIWIHIRWIQYEFIYFLHLNIWIHRNMNSYYVWIHILFAVIMYEFIHFLQYEFLLCMNSYTFCSCHVWIHKFFSVQNKSCECTRAASAQREPQGWSPSSPPAPTRPRPAALTVRVACSSPNS